MNAMASCKICNHPEREKIEAAIVANAPNRAVSRQFTDVSKDAVSRHKQNCMRSAIEAVQIKQREQTVQAVEEAVEQQEHFVWNLFTEMQWLHNEVRIVYGLAKGGGDFNASAKLLGEARQQMKLFSELLAGNEPGQAEKLEQEWIAVREAIFNALEPYPEARLAVAEALFALGRADDHESSQQLLQATTPDNTS